MTGGITPGLSRRGTRKEYRLMRPSSRGKTGRNSVMSSKVTYRQQYTRCGKERCRKCKEGAGHGPYWYAYWSDNGRTISKYVGIHLPAGIELERQAGVEAKIGRGKRSVLAANQFTPVNTASTVDKILVSGDVPGIPLQLNSQVLRIYALGQFRVERLQANDWHTVVNRTWHRRRAR